MSKKLKIKAHDILSDEKFSEKSVSAEPENIEKTDGKEIRLAHIIYSFLISQKKVPSAEEKEQTKRRIKTSIKRLNRNRHLVPWSVAASILLIICSVWYLQNINNKPNILDVAQTLNVIKPDSVTHLILQDGRKVLIDDEESQIIYDKNGENIVIDSAQKISQKIIQENPVFNTLIVPYGKRTQITLSDGSKVWLNSGSKLIYPAANTKGKREVYIEGEAVFEVTHSEQNPFYVNTKDFEIKVLGTVFNVSAYPEDEVSSTVLEKGKIELDSKENTLLHRKRITILPGTMAVFDPEGKTFVQQQVDTKNYLSWRDGYLIFGREPLKNILKKLERYYNVEIVLQDIRLGEETFSGNLDLKNSPEEVLKIIAETTPFLVRYENKKLFIEIK